MQDEEIKREIEEGYQEVLFLPRPLQARELNVLQSFLNTKIARIGKSLFRDGSLLEGKITMDVNKFNIEECSVFFEGFPYRLKKQEISREEGQTYLLAKLTKSVVTSKDDFKLKENIKGTNFDNPGADRTKVEIKLKASKTKETGYIPLEVKEPTIVQDSLFDLVIHTDNIRVGFRKIKDGMRVLVIGGVFRVHEPLVIDASNVHIEFQPSVRILGTSTTPKDYFFILKGVNVSMTNLVYGWDTEPAGINFDKVTSSNYSDKDKNTEQPELIRSVQYGLFRGYSADTAIRIKNIKDYR